MKTRHIATAALAALIAAPAMAQITITVTPSLAPNAFGSSYWPTYVSNAVGALYSGATTAGTPNTPGYYAPITGPINVRDNIVTGFVSWRGDADPATTYGAAYGSEYGNRVHFGVVIDGHGQQISIADLAFTASSSDAGDGLGFSFVTGSYNYSSDYMGVIHGSSGDTFVTSGPNTQLVDEIVGRGSGNAYAVYSTDPGATNQDKIDNLAAQLGAYDFTGTYTIDGVAGSATVQAVVPEPASLGALCIGALAMLRRRRKS